MPFDHGPGGGAGPVRLDLGAGDVTIPGFRPIDRKRGLEVYPLDAGADMVDEIRASHVLEHFSHTRIGAVLADWVRALKPGGLLRVAVPDFKRCAELYLAGSEVPIQGWVMGGHVDDDDRHGAIFDEEALREALVAAGLVDIRTWASEIEDCAALPISLNLAGTKPGGPPTRPYGLKVGAAISVPRLGFQDHFFTLIEGLLPFGIQPRRAMGASWGQCLERCMEEVMSEGNDAVLALDYDTVFTRRTIEDLLALFAAHPEIDALAPVQASRHNGAPLFTVAGADGRNARHVAADELAKPLLTARTAHFGCTLIRSSALADLPHPWFHAQPNAEGRWGEGRADDDTSFWHAWARAGKSLAIATRTVIGHLELGVRWPGPALQTVFQELGNWREAGAPKGIWQ